jgi:hypothetical protein
LHATPPSQETGEVRNLVRILRCVANAENNRVSGFVLANHALKKNETAFNSRA